MLLGFKQRFVEPILSGRKTQTIRNPRKIRPKVGEVMHMYTGLRTKYCKFICNNHKLISIQNITISAWCKANNIKVRVSVDKRILTASEIEELAIRDGFDNTADFAWYFLDGKPRYKAKMELYHWTDFKY
jgi:uncharacterized protein YqfB (UPF0267 family)